MNGTDKRPPTGDSFGLLYGHPPVRAVLAKITVEKHTSKCLQGPETYPVQF